MTDFRTLCAELLSHIDYLNEEHWLPGSIYADRARAALAQPEPQGPTDEEIMELMPQQMHEDLAAAARALAEQAGTDSRSATGVMRIMLNRHTVDLARAVLVRWGCPVIEPDGPAVPDGREPASVADQPTDKEPLSPAAELEGSDA